jgi:hypothetical protein
MTETTETGPAREDSTERCTNDSCGHTKRDHSGRRDHTTKHPDIPLRPWCHACKTECLYEPAATVPASAPTDGSVREHLLDALDFAYCQGLGYSTPEELLAAYDATLLPAPTDQTALRDRIAAAIIESDGVPSFEFAAKLHRVAAFREADAVLTVLPELADRAAIRAAALREAADFVGNDDDCDCGGCDTCLPRKLAAELRRMADASGPGGVAGETQQPDPAAPELTAEEARALVDQMGLDLYRAQDAIEFARECCDIADREQRSVTTADVREWLKGDRCTRQRAAGETQQPETQADDEGLRAKVDDATSTLRRIRSAIRTLKEQGATGQTYHQVITNALAGPRPDEAPEPETEEDIVREHVTTVHLIGEQLADVESWLWKRLADVRAEQPAAVSQPDEEA